MSVKVMVSYARSDAPVIDEFKALLSGDIDRGRIELLIDRDFLRDVDEWRPEIEHALATAQIALLFVSNHSMTSRFVQQEEVPRILEAHAAGRLRFRPIFLSPSVRVAWRDPRTGADIDVSSFQALGSSAPDRPLLQARGVARARHWVDAVEALRRLVAEVEAASSPAPGSLARSGRPMLRVRVRASGPQLAVQRSVNGGPFGPAGAAGGELVLRARAGEPDALGEILLGPPDDRAALLALAHGLEADRQPGPQFGPVDILLEADASARVAFLPWLTAAVDGVGLARICGFTVQLLTTAAPGAATRSFLPAPVLLLVGDTPVGRTHAEAVASLVDGAWPGRSGDLVRFARTPDELAAAVRERPGAIFGFAGPAVVQNGDFALEVGAHRIGAAELDRVLGGARLPLALFDLVGPAPGESQAGTALAACAETMLLRLFRPGTPPGLELWRDALTTGHDIRERLALPVEGLRLTAAFTRNLAFAATVQDHGPRLGRAATWLDRMPQRTRFDGELRLLCDYEPPVPGQPSAVRRKVLAVVARGTDGHRLESLSAPLKLWVEQMSSDDVRLALRRMVPPEPARRGRDGFLDALRMGLDVQPGWNLTQAIRGVFGSTTARSSRVLMLDWQVFGRSDADADELFPPLSEDDLRVWLAFAADPLVELCPDDVRLVHYLGVKGSEATLAAVEEAVDSLVEDLPAYSQGLVRRVVLPPCEHVKARDIADFLDKDENSTCPRALVARMPALLVAETGGHFARVVELIDQAELTGWYSLYATLAQRHGETNAGRPRAESRAPGARVRVFE